MPEVYIAGVPGLNNSIVPREIHYDPKWEDSDASDILDSPPNGKFHRHPIYARKTSRNQTNMVQVAPGRSWWLRLLVDSMLIPFVQGFMLNMGVHWIRYWRGTGGLLGVFRRWRFYKK
ncbi:hypothetical protein IW140_002208 [Coemansia sp. RSA 1813]|nr:hypothetical protein EV178_001716 [Coemansia sp. RSA 1646]KAJ2216290.1 hypothetical protein EV179_001529 [Coemansia sp. RSA 487]KAJ2570537.1 hypothetical protein IW140_002208 [Coemansia sp. RSA 1813]